jgi:hypothetical protein
MEKERDSGEVDLFKEIGLRMEGVREIQKMPKSIPEDTLSFGIGFMLHQLGDAKYVKDALVWGVVECMMLLERMSFDGKQAVLRILEYLAKYESLHQDNIAYMIIRFRDMPMPEEDE